MVKDLVNTVSRGSIDLGFGEAKDGPPGSGKGGVSSGVFVFHARQVVPVCAIGFNCQSISDKGKINDKAEQVVLKNVNNLPPIQFVSDSSLDRSWTDSPNLGGGGRASALCGAEPSAIATLDDVWHYVEYLTARPASAFDVLLALWHLAPAVGASLRAIIALVFLELAGIKEKVFSTVQAGALYLLNMARWFCSGSCGATPATEPPVAIFAIICKDVHWLSAILASRIDVLYPLAAIGPFVKTYRGTKSGRIVLESGRWHIERLTARLANHLYRHNKIPPVRDSCIQSAGAGPLQVTGFSDWLARPFLSPSAV